MPVRLSSYTNKVLPILFLMLVVFTQYYFDIQRNQRPITPPSVIPAQAIKLGDLGLHSAMAGLMWIRAIQKFGDYPKELPKLVENINVIDPKFSYPYAFSVLILPTLDLPDKAVEIGKRGLAEADTDWRIPYYMATTYHIFLKDRENSALYFDIAARTPGAPDSIKSIAARYGTYKTALEQTKQIWLSIYETSNDEVTMERAKNYIVHIELIEMLQRAVLVYKQKYGIQPKSIEDLVSGKIIKQVPESPLGATFKIRTDGEITVE